MHFAFIQIFWNTCNSMFCNYILNGLMIFFTFFELSTSLHELNHTFWTYWNHYSNVHIALINIQCNITLHFYLNGLVNFSTSFKLSTFAHELILGYVKSIAYDLHFAHTIIVWNGCIKIRQVLHLYLNGLVIKSNCSCM